jgi:hypothetical protein
MTSIVDEEIMKSEDGQELIVPPTGEDHETYEEIHISHLALNLNLIIQLTKFV